jgi:hypothetical protein
VSVRIDGQQVRVGGNSKSIRYHEVFRAGRDVELVVPLKFDHDGEAGGRLIGEIETQCGRNLTRLAGGLEMSVEDQQIAGIETPGESLRLGVGQRSRFPKQEVAFGVERIAVDGDIHSRKAAPGVCF